MVKRRTAGNLPTSTTPDVEVILTDITERKQAEEALRESQEFSSSLLENSPNPILVINPDTSVRYVNPAFKKLTGFNLAEITSRKAPYPWWLKEQRKEIAAALKNAMANGGSRTEWNFQKKNGERFWAVVNSAPVVHDGEPIYFLINWLDITERKQIEEALADEATRRRILVDQSRDGIVILDENGKVFEANQQFAEMLGYTPEEVAQLYVWDWEYLFPREQVLEMIRTVDEAGDHFETRHRRKDGSVYDVEISTNGTIFAGQKLIFCVCRDITERKQADKALQEAEEKYKNLIEATSDMIWEADEKGTFTFVSPRIKDILGYEVNEVVGKIRTLDLTPKEEARKWLNRFKEINAKKAPFFGFEITHLHKNGNQVVFEISGIPLFDSAGNFKGFVGINKDITERKKAEERVRSAAEEWRTTFDSITDFISIHDRNNRIVRMNKAFADALKTTPKELIGKFCHELTHGTKEPPANCPQRQTLKTGKPATIEVYDSNLGIYVQESTSPIFDEKGKVAGSVHIAKNITERKQMEEQLMLTDRLASIGELASGIAHELNNPLTSVIGFSQLLLEEDIPENLKEDLVTIYSEAQRASSIVKNLLTFARKHAPMRQLSQVNSIIDDVLRLRAYEHKVNNIKVEKRFAPNLPEIMVDYFQMQQVFLNIIVNAESSMLQANGKGKLVITTARVNNVIKATIADDGPGIAKENLRRVFDPFFTTKEVGKGTGLGLSICHGIVTEHGGRIYAESEISKGAAFAVELPIDGRPRRKEEQV